MNKTSLLFIGVLIAAPLAAHAEDSGYQVQQSVSFAANSNKLSPAAEKKLREDVESLSTLLRYRPESSIEIAGYAAPSEKKPGPLADQRAQKVWEYLISQGLPAERMEPVGHGAAKGSNSRVDIRISAEDLQAMNQASQLMAAPAQEAAPAPAPSAPAAPAPAAEAPAATAPPAVAATPSAPEAAPTPSKAEQAAQAKREAAEARRARAEELKRQRAEQAEAARQAQLRAAEQRKAAQEAELERKQAAAEMKRQAAEEKKRQQAEAAESARQAKLKAAEERKAAQQAALEKKQAEAEARRQAQAEAREKAKQAALEKKQAAEAAKKAAEQAAMQQAMNTPPPTLTPEATDKALLTEKGKKIVDNQFGGSYIAPPSAKAPPKSALPGEGSYFIQGTAYFSANSRSLTPGSSATIEALAIRLQKLIAARPNVRVDIVGHADPLTEAQQADVLAEGRAEELMKELVARGVDREHLHPAGASDTQPLTSKPGDPARNLNMRAEIRVPTS